MEQDSAAERARLQSAMTKMAQDNAERIRAHRRDNIDDGLPRSIEETLVIMQALMAVPTLVDTERKTAVRSTILPLITQLFRHGYGLAALDDRITEYDTLLGGLLDTPAPNPSPGRSPQVTRRARGRKKDAAVDAQAVGRPRTDAVSQATAIVKSASCDTIDWSAEPHTDYERRVRAAYLRKYLDGFMPSSLATEASILRLSGKRVASDLAAAAEEGMRRSEILQAEHERKKIRKAREEVDGES